MVPWGRSFEEYQVMFGLSEDDLKKRILGCGDGPASFNAEATKRGSKVTSCDPVYQFESKEIRRRIDEVYTEIMAKMKQGADGYIWDSLGSVEELGRLSKDGIDVSLQAVSYRFQKGATEMLVAKSV